MLRNRIYVYSFPDSPRKLFEFDTRDNPKGEKTQICSCKSVRLWKRRGRGEEIREKGWILTCLGEALCKRCNPLNPTVPLPYPQSCPTGQQKALTENMARCVHEPWASKDLLAA